MDDSQSKCLELEKAIDAYIVIERCALQFGDEEVVDGLVALREWMECSASTIYGNASKKLQSHHILADSGDE